MIARSRDRIVAPGVEDAGWRMSVTVGPVSMQKVE